jgi:RHS repeat-associated protein
VAPANDAAFVWDANGNPVSRTIGGVVTEYAYDTLDKLLEVRSGATTVARFQYDYAGRRTQKVGADGAVQYVHDGTAVLEELDATTGGVRAKYEWGSDRLISLFRTSEVRRYYSFDGLGSVTNLTDVSGTSVASYHLDAWGNYRFPGELSASANRFGFTGHEWDAETKLYYAKARYFDPQLGRFLTQDSYLGEIDDPPSLHRYFYANANPTKFVDPTGHASGPAAVFQVVSWLKQQFSFNETGTTEVPPSQATSSAGTRWQADVPRTEYKNPVARQRAAEGNLKLAEQAEAGHGCAYCHTVKEHGTLADADASIDLEHYSSVALMARAGAVAGEALVIAGLARTFGRYGVPHETSEANQQPNGTIGEGSGSASEIRPTQGAPQPPTPAKAKGQDAPQATQTGEVPNTGRRQAFYRGAKPGQAPDLTPKPNEFKVDPATGYVKDTHGVSVFNNPESVSSKGFEPHQVDQTTIPDTLRIRQRGKDPAHYEIMPQEGAKLTPAEFTQACKGIGCKQ